MAPKRRTRGFLAQTENVAVLSALVVCVLVSRALFLAFDSVLADRALPLGTWFLLVLPALTLGFLVRRLSAHWNLLLGYPFLALSLVLAVRALSSTERKSLPTPEPVKFFLVSANVFTLEVIGLLGLALVAPSLLDFARRRWRKSPPRPGQGPTRGVSHR